MVETAWLAFGERSLCLLVVLMEATVVLVAMCILRLKEVLVLWESSGISGDSRRQPGKVEVSRRGTVLAVMTL